ncbi:MAG: hypothetical protein KF753_18910 [Caldilineaceae bacterium]|nr:hypothetical protein [Caldilineaceae bacterium]
MILRSPSETSIETERTLRLQEEVALLPIALLDGPTANEMLFSMNLRQDWRGFSFGNFWFGYYFGTDHSSPQTEERWAV